MRSLLDSVLLGCGSERTVRPRPAMTLLAQCSLRSSVNLANCHHWVVKRTAASETRPSPRGAFAQSTNDSYISLQPRKSRSKHNKQRWQWWSQLPMWCGSSHRSVSTKLNNLGSKDSLWMKEDNCRVIANQLQWIFYSCYSIALIVYVRYWAIWIDTSK